MNSGVRRSAALAARLQARAEFRVWEAVLAEHDLVVAEAAADPTESAYGRHLAVRAVAVDLARALSQSEHQIWKMINHGTLVREGLPEVWAAFRAGHLSALKVNVIAVEIERLRVEGSWAKIDPRIAEYAACHPHHEVRRWLSRLVDRLQPTPIDVAEEARASRRVSVEYREHGMAWVSGFVPAVAAAALMKRLGKAARRLDDDGRTLVQKEADLFVAWLTNAEGTESDIAAEVAVVIDAAALAGITDASATVLAPDSTDVGMPASWVLDLALTDSVLFTRLITDPQGRVLDVTFLGYQPPDSLRRAITWRDGRCRVRGCARRATDCDLDHRLAWDRGGTTSADNLQALCRTHHSFKGHGLLPADAFGPPDPVVTRLPYRDAA